jgi:baseplate J-like protein
VIDFSQQTYENILQEMLDRISDNYDKRDTSPIPTAIGPAAYAFEGFYLSLNQVQKMAFIQTAAGQALDYLAAIGGLTRYTASATVRLGIFNVDVPIGSRFSTINGTDSINFVVTAATSIAGQYQMTAETAGTIGNAYSGSILPITTISGLTSAQISDILVPGDDEETDDALRSRLLSALNIRAFGGNITAYHEDILAIDGVGAVQVYPVWNGAGTVKCSVMGADYLPASTTLVANVQNAIDPTPNRGLGLGLAPIGAQVTITAPTKVTVDISADITLATGYTLDQVTPIVKSSLETYMLSVRKSWGEQLGTTEVKYAANVYVSRILASIVGTVGIVNAVNVQLNKQTSDLILTESASVQQIPVLGEVTLRV